MLALLRKYRGHLARKAAEARPGISTVEMNWQIIPWFAALLPAILICYWWNLKGDATLPVVLPCLVISICGGLYVIWVFMIEGPLAAFKKRKKTPEDDR